MSPMGDRLAVMCNAATVGTADEPDQVVLRPPGDPDGNSWRPSTITGTLVWASGLVPMTGIVRIGDVSVRIEGRWPAKRW